MFDDEEITKPSTRETIEDVSDRYWREKAKDAREIFDEDPITEPLGSMPSRVVLDLDNHEPDEELGGES